MKQPKLLRKPATNIPNSDHEKSRRIVRRICGRDRTEPAARSQQNPRPSSAQAHGIHLRRGSSRWRPHDPVNQCSAADKQPGYVGDYHSYPRCARHVRRLHSAKCGPCRQTSRALDQKDQHDEVDHAREYRAEECIKRDQRDTILPYRVHRVGRGLYVRG